MTTKQRPVLSAFMDAAHSPRHLPHLPSTEAKSRYSVTTPAHLRIYRRLSGLVQDGDPLRLATQFRRRDELAALSRGLGSTSLCRVLAPFLDLRQPLGMLGALSQSKRHLPREARRMTQWEAKARGQRRSLNCGSRHGAPKANAEWMGRFPSPGTAISRRGRGRRLSGGGR
jgi:hypothetical protein